MKRGFKYQRVSQDLRDKIHRGGYRPGDRFPSQRDLMVEYGVSFSTITSALSTLAREGLIVSQHGRGTFVAHRKDSDTGLDGQAAVTLGLLIPGVSSHPTGILKGVYDEASETNVKLKFIVFHGNDEKRQRCRDILDRTIEVDGCLIMYLPGYKAVVAALREAGFPYMIVDSPCVYEGMNQVVQDHRRGAEIAVSHLIRHGHERIAYLGHPVADDEGNTDCWLQSKLEGYRNALRDAGLQLAPELMVEATSTSRRDVAGSMRELLSRGDFTGLFVSIGKSAMPVIDVLREEGKRVPLDVAITSLSADEIPEMVEDRYSVSGMCAPRVETGRAAVRALTRLVDGRLPRDVPYVEELQMTLLKRRSCGCA